MRELRVWDQAVATFLEDVRRTATKRLEVIPAKTVLFRAQLGIREGLRVEDDAVFDPIPYRPDRMMPDPKRVQSGRANLPRAAVVYAASNKETAVAEVRPWLGMEVSVATLATTRDLRAVNLTSTSQALTLDERLGRIAVTPEKTETAVWAAIGQAFSRPVARGDEATGYRPTQVLAQMLRDEGADALVYTSALVKEGFNVAIFGLDDVEVICVEPREVTVVCVESKQTGNPSFFAR